MKKIFYDLTNPQKSIWLTEQFYNNTINNICGTLFIREKVNFDVLKKAIKLFVKSSDNFNIKLSVTKDGPKQYLDDFCDFEIPIVSLKSKDEVSTLEQEIVNSKFDINNSRLFLFKLFKFDDSTGGILISVHHLIADAWSLGLIIDGVMNTYSNILKNKDFSPEKAPSYIDYIYSEKEYLNSEKFKKDELFWNDAFKEIPEVAAIPSRNISSSSISARKKITLSKKLLESINEFCKNHKVSMYNFLMAVFALYIGNVSNLDDFVIGTPILNRNNFKEKHTARNVCFYNSF